MPGRPDTVAVKRCGCPHCEWHLGAEYTAVARDVALHPRGILVGWGGNVTWGEA
jgi:hypothetical protein